ncbi:MAG TPA: ATP-binding protein [Micavibrio sp.]|nr:ATP-binding protein [Micavibrio sp.]
MIRRVYRMVKNLLPRTLFGRSLLILVTPIFLVQIITTFIFFDRHWQKMGDRLAYAVAGEITMIANEIEQDDSDDNLHRMQLNASKTISLFVQYKRGEALDRVFDDNRTGFQNPSRENIIGQTLAKAFYQQLERPFNIVIATDEKWVEVSTQLKGGLLQVTLPERRIFSSSGYIVLLWMMGSSIILLIIATIFMRNQIKPIRRLAIAAERFGKGRDVPFFKVEGAREVRQAARAFIDMKDRLQRQIQQRTALLAGVSHDLRTPLTRMKLQLEMMDGADAADLKSDIVDMERMIGAYLQFARGDGEEEAVRTDLRALLEQAARGMNREQERVALDMKEDITLLLRPVAFARCIGNLLSNALQYGERAWISVCRFGEHIEICIDDNGPGIPPSQYEDVFKPFFRGESSRNARTGGVGLGLPIVQDIVLSHGGQVWLDRSPQGGLRVVIDLPV